MKYSIELLKSQVLEGIQHEYLFFWGHTPKTPDVADKSCFSQWYPSPFVVDDVTYATTEHWMMAKKALLFNDEEAYHKILAAEKPAVAKAIGRTIKHFDNTIWKESSYSIVTEGNYHKFSQYPALRTFLLQTKKKILVEASPSDEIWGIGLSQDSETASNPLKWRGTNWLGFALMEVRDMLAINQG